MLVLDQSGSMSEGRHPTDPGNLRVRDSASLLEFVASRSSPTTVNRFGIVNFGTTAPPQDAVPLTPISSLADPELPRLRRQLRSYDLHDTSFISALRLANEMMRQAGSYGRQRNRAIIIFTDGKPDDVRNLTQTGYFAELKKFEDTVARPQGVRVFVVGIDTEGQNWGATASSWKNVVGPDQVFTAANFHSLQAQFNRIVQRIYHLPEVPPTDVIPPQHADFAVDPYLAAVEFHIFPSRQGVTLNIYRPDGKKVQPGRDADTPPVKQLSTFQRLVVYEPTPGNWHYEAVGGRVTVLRNPIPLHMALVSPKPVHPRGKPLLLVAQFQRTDGKTVQSDPDYPLGLSAEVVTPDHRHIAVKFPMEQGHGGLYTGEPVIQDTMTGGEYRVILKVNGGGKYEDRYPITVQVKDIPYLLVDAPVAGSPVLPGSTVTVQARLMQGGKPLLPQHAFSNHPDQLVMAQVRGEGGSKANKVYVASVPSGNGSTGNTFSGAVPAPSVTPGQYTLAIALAPEEKSKQSVADETVLPFAAEYPPPPLWHTLLIWGLPTVLVAALLYALLRKRAQNRLRLSFFFWAEGQPTKTVMTFTKADEVRDLPGLPLHIARLGSQKRVKIQPIQDATLMRSDGTEIPEVETEIGGLLRVQPTSGSIKSVSYDFQANLLQPQPAPVLESDMGTASEAATEPENQPVRDESTPTSGENSGWNFN